MSSFNVLGFGFRSQGFEFDVCRIGFRVPGVGIHDSRLELISHLELPLSGSHFPVTGFTFRVSGVGLRSRVPSFGFCGLSFKIRVSSFGFSFDIRVSISGFGFTIRVSSLGSGGEIIVILRR